MERGGEGGGTDRHTERLRQREGERKTEAEGKGRRNCRETMMEQKGGDLEAREQAREVGGGRGDQSERRNTERTRPREKKQRGRNGAKERSKTRE